MVAKKSVQMVVVLNIEHSSADIWYFGFVYGWRIIFTEAFSQHVSEGDAGGE